MLRSWFALGSPVDFGGKRVASVDIFDVIAPGWWGVNATDFRDQLNAAGPVDQIDLHIHSRGGDITEGLAIFNTLVDHPARVVAHIDGLAASMAGIIAMAADEVHIADGGYFMVHNPKGLGFGEADQLRNHADLLDKYKATAIRAYQRHTKLSAQELSDLMDAETWYDAPGAVEAGFAQVRKGVPPPADPEADQNLMATMCAGGAAPRRLDLSAFARVPPAVAALYALTPNPGAGAPQEASMSQPKTPPVAPPAPATPTSEAAADPTSELVARVQGLEADATARIASLEARAAELAATGERLRQRENELAVDSLLSSLGGRLTPAITRNGHPREVLLAARSSAATVTVTGADGKPTAVPLFDAVASLLKSLPDTLGLLGGELATEAKADDGTIGDPRDPATREFHARAGIDAARHEYLRTKFALN